MNAVISFSWTFIVTSVTALNELYQIETFRTSKMVWPGCAANSRRRAGAG